jgi:PEP-CTERM motif
VGLTFVLLGQSQRVSTVLTGTLLAGQSEEVGVLFLYSGVAHVTAPASLATFIGTGVLGPDAPLEVAPFASGTPGIFLVSGQPEAPNYVQQAGGTETIVYTYGIPEPASVALLAVGLAAALLVRMKKGRRRPA